MYINKVYDRLMQIIEKNDKNTIIPINICADINSFSFADVNEEVIKNNYEYILALIIHHHYIKYGQLPEGLPEGCKNPHTKILKDNGGILCNFLSFDVKLQLAIKIFLLKPSELFN